MSSRTLVQPPSFQTSNSSDTISCTPKENFTRRCGSPIHQEDADLLIRTIDQVDFAVHKEKIALESKLWAGRLLVTPTPAIEDVEEASDVWKIILLHIPGYGYPGGNRPEIFTDLGSIYVAHIVAKSHRMNGVSKELWNLLENKMPETPIKAFYTIYMERDRPGWSISHCRAAAYHTLAGPVEGDLLPGKGEISDEARRMIEVYRHDCGFAATRGLRRSIGRLDKDDPQSPPCWLRCSTCTQAAYPESHDSRHGDLQHTPPVAAWFAKYLEDIVANIGDQCIVPSIDSILDDESLSRAYLDKGAACTTCSTEGPRDLARFREVAKHNIEQAISEVQLRRYDMPSA